MRTTEKVIQVDSITRYRPHIRHRAVINRVRRPYASEAGEKILDSELALTVCGCSLSNYMNADDLSLFAADGSEFSVQCTGCYGR